jgi:hypothetical protein
MLTSGLIPASLKWRKVTRGWFSKKVDGRGIKVQFIVDATERVRYVHGPVEPGQYDGSFLELRRDEIIEKFPGGKFIGDNHYSSGMELFKDPVFYCNERESAKDRKVAEKEGLETHSRAPKKKKRKVEIDLATVPVEDQEHSVKKLKTNAVISHSRGLIEGVFGNMKRQFRTIGERKIQNKMYLFQTVVIAAAINNMILVQSNHL